MWYSNYMKKLALRKNMLNVDLHIHALEDPNTGLDASYEYQYKHLIDILGSAILKGLDIIGIVSRYSDEPGEICSEIIKEKNYDIVNLSGIENKSSEGINVIIFNFNYLPKQKLSIERLCRLTHKEGGLVMAIQPSIRQVQIMNKLIGSSGAPDFIEIFNNVSQGGYSKSFVDTDPAPEFHLVMNSAARNAKDLDNSLLVSRIPRKFFVDKGILDQNQLVDFVPNYLNKYNESNKGII